MYFSWWVIHEKSQDYPEADRIWSQNIFHNRHTKPQQAVLENVENQCLKQKRLCGKVYLSFVVKWVFRLFQVKLSNLSGQCEL